MTKPKTRAELEQVRHELRATTKERDQALHWRDVAREDVRREREVSAGLGADLDQIRRMVGAYFAEPTLEGVREYVSRATQLEGERDRARTEAAGLRALLEATQDAQGLALPAGWRWKVDHHGGWEIRDRAGKEIGCVVHRAADCYTWHGEGSDGGQAPGVLPACRALAASLREQFGGRGEKTTGELEAAEALAQERAHALELERDELRAELESRQAGAAAVDGLVRGYRDRLVLANDEIDRLRRGWRREAARRRRTLGRVRGTCRRLRRERDTMRALVLTRGHVIDALEQKCAELRAELARRQRTAAPPELGRLDPAHLPALPAGWWWQQGDGGMWLVWDAPKHAAGMVQEWGSGWRAMTAAEDHEGGAVQEFFSQIAAGEWLADRLRQLAPSPTPSPGEDLSLPPGYRWHADGDGWIVLTDTIAGDVQRHREHCYTWHESAGFPSTWTSGVHTDEAGARASLARRLRKRAAAAFACAAERPDHCTPDHASAGAFRAPCTRTRSGAAVQGCTGEPSPPETAGTTLGDLVRAADGAGCELEVSFTPRDPCSPAQPERLRRAAQEARGAGRFPRGRGGPGVSGPSAREGWSKVGEIGAVAKAGPSPADRESAVNQGQRARLANAGCAEGALAGGPEPSAGGREGWFGTVDEGERVEPGGSLRVALAVLGGVDLIWWLCVRLLYLCGRRSSDEPGTPGARWLGIGWRDASVPGGALAEAWIGYVPTTAEPRDGWPVGWAWRACPLEPPGWNLNPELDDRAFQEPGAIGVLVQGPRGRAQLAACVTAWGDRWTAPGFDAERLVCLLSAEMADAELRAEARDETEDYPDDEDDPDAPEPAATSPQPAWMQDAPPLPAGLVWGWDGVWMKIFDPSGEEVASAVHNGHAWLWKVGGRWAGAKNRRAAMLKIAEALATQEAELRTEARDETDDHPDDEDAPTAAIKVLIAYAKEIRQRGRVRQEGASPNGLSDCMRRALDELTPREREILRQRCPGIPPLAADLRPEDLPDAHEETTPARAVAFTDWQREEPEAVHETAPPDERPPATCRTGQEPAADPVAERLPTGWAWWLEENRTVLRNATQKRLGFVERVEVKGGARWAWESCAHAGTRSSKDAAQTVLVRVVKREIGLELGEPGQALDEPWDDEDRALLAVPCGPPATCRTGEAPPAAPVAAFPELPAGLEWRELDGGALVLVETEETGEQIGTVDRLSDGRWRWAELGETGDIRQRGEKDTREAAARMLVAIAWGKR